MLCSRCKKRPAVIYISKIEGEQKSNDGLCLVCAKELNIPQVNDIIKRMGITDEDLEDMSEQLGELMGNISDDDGGENEDVTPGGPATFPSFLANFLGNNTAANRMSESDKKDSPKPERKNGEKPQKDEEKGEKGRKFLNTYCTNYTRLASEEKFDRIIGRDREIERMVQILSRRTKNNPCLIGEPGVGKTAIVEGLAQRIVAGNVPYVLRSKELFLLDLTSLVAGTQFRGQFEARVKSLVDEARADGNIILFIDEVHNLAGAGDSADGSMNAANLLKPALSRGEIQIIGATTFKEYRKHIEKDAALERRFQPITVEEPSVEETVNVLSGLKGYYESFHGVSVDSGLVRHAVELSERYINDRFLPDKAIDLLDEAAACASLRNPHLQEYRRVKSELEAGKNQLAELEASEATEVEDIDRKYEQLAVLHSKVLQLQQRVAELEPEANAAALTYEDLAKVIQLWTGIDASKISQTDVHKLASLESRLSERIIGQDNAVKAVSAAIRRTRIQLYEKKRPASFIFAGPTGVGKTELVKVLAQALFDTPDNMIRVDMSEYMEKHSVSRLLGSPPGYVGYNDAGQLTEKVRRKPYSVVLFDEIEKAHPDIMHVLLQILDDGQVTDSQGRKVDFSNTVIIMTTNAGSDIAGTGLGFAKTGREIVSDKVQKALSQFLRPEFLGRIDEVIIFDPLDFDTLKSIAELMLSDIKTGLASQSVVFGWEPAVPEKLAELSSGSKFGARELRKNLRKLVEDKIGDVIAAKGSMPALIKMTADNGEFIAVTD